MRAFFLLLVLVNLAYFAYGRVVLEGEGGEGRIPQLQVAAERIKLVKATERAPAATPQVPGKALPPAPPKTATAAPAGGLPRVGHLRRPRRCPRGTRAREP